MQRVLQAGAPHRELPVAAGVLQDEVVDLLHGVPQLVVGVDRRQLQLRDQPVHLQACMNIPLPRHSRTGCLPQISCAVACCGAPLSAALTLRSACPDYVGYSYFKASKMSAVQLTCVLEPHRVLRLRYPSSCSMIPITQHPSVSAPAGSPNFTAASKHQRLMTMVKLHQSD